MNRLVVLDTNVIVSAGIDARVFPNYIVSKAIEGDLIATVCPSIEQEYREVLSRPKFKRFGLPPIWLDVLINQSHFLPRDPPKVITDGPDKDDLIFLNLALYVGAILITGNIKHFPKTIAKQAIVLKPAEYVSMLHSEETIL